MHVLDAKICHVAAKIVLVIKVIEDTCSARYSRAKQKGTTAKVVPFA